MICLHEPWATSIRILAIEAYDVGGQLVLTNRFHGGHPLIDKLIYLLVAAEVVVSDDIAQ